MTNIDAMAFSTPFFAAVHHASPVLIGCAGWSLPGTVKDDFPADGSHLERYASVFPAVEINTSFYRPHRAATYARWRDSVPASFRFSAKVPKAVTHEARLHDIDERLQRFVDEVSHLEEKLGCLLVQLPPSLRYEAQVAQRFFETLRSLVKADLVCEPRHPTWFGPDAARMLASLRVAYADADPHPVGLPLPPNETETVYIRLHGSPVMYHSVYSDAYLDKLSADIEELRRSGKRVWCIFDNTASGAAVPNALALLERCHRISAGAGGGVDSQADNT